MSIENDWLKHKGYIHLTPQIDIIARRHEIISKVTNVNYVKSYAFFPLIHSSIKERRYKKAKQSTQKAHSYKDENGRIKTNVKERPLHYSCHMDALIFGYYASILQKKYEEELLKNKKISDSIIAYRRIPIDNTDKNKSTIHFAKEAFDEIIHRVNKDDECCVLMFDIKSFFSRINHSILQNAWEKLIGESPLPPDHKNVFNAATRFSYVLYDDLREKNGLKNKKGGLNEKRLAEIRKTGKHSFFESPKEFREKVKCKELRLYRFPFRDADKVPVGIPQGLAISAVLANLYLLDFDKKVFDNIVVNKDSFYRRYSDDILVICKPGDADFIKNYIKTTIEANKVQISPEKTEEFIFQKATIRNSIQQIISIKVKDGIRQMGLPLTYLGFEFYGNKVLIKSANLSKFYRRMIYAVKNKAKRARIRMQKSPDSTFAIYRRQLYKLYTIHDLNATSVRTSINKLVKNEKGFYEFSVITIDKQFKSNYLTYVNRVSDIMNTDSVKKQIRNHKRILNETIHKQLKKNKLLLGI